MKSFDIFLTMELREHWTLIKYNLNTQWDSNMNIALYLIITRKVLGWVPR